MVPYCMIFNILGLSVDLIFRVSGSLYARNTYVRGYCLYNHYRLLILPSALTEFSILELPQVGNFYFYCVANFFLYCKLNNVSLSRARALIPLGYHMVTLSLGPGPFVYCEVHYLINNVYLSFNSQ